MNRPAPASLSPWPHRAAVLLVCATFPLIWVGGLVTTYEAGMAVPDWPTTYGYNLFLYPWQTWLFGPWDLFIEHGHRLLAALVGLLTIGLVVVVWRCDQRRWMRVASLAALAAVIFQGVLGGLRVVLDERLLAKIHGCFGPAFFGLCVALAVFTSRRWLEAGQPNWQPAAARLHAVALLTTLFAYLQIVLGAQLRHVTATLDVSTFRTAVMFHLLVAGVLTLLILVLAGRVLKRYRHDRALLRPTLGLLALVWTQLSLGAATWVVNYNWPGWLGDYDWAQGSVVVHEGLLQTLITTAHVAVGSLIFVTSLVVTLRSLRFYRVAAHRPAVLPTSVGVLA